MADDLESQLLFNLFEPQLYHSLEAPLPDQTPVTWDSASLSSRSPSPNSLNSHLYNLQHYHHHPPSFAPSSVPILSTTPPPDSMHGSALTHSAAAFAPYNYHSNPSPPSVSLHMPASISLPNLFNPTSSFVSSSGSTIQTSPPPHSSIAAISMSNPAPAQPNGSNGSSSAYTHDSISTAGIAGPQRTKRPKYTRSKKGCLTCRAKKVKCDERKPMCTRCEHGHRSCTWPDSVLPRRVKPSNGRSVGADDQDSDDEQPDSATVPTSASSLGFPPPLQTNVAPAGAVRSPFEPSPASLSAPEYDYGYRSSQGTSPNRFDGGYKMPAVQPQSYNQSWTHSRSGSGSHLGLAVPPRSPAISVTSYNSEPYSGVATYENGAYDPFSKAQAQGQWDQDRQQWNRSSSVQGGSGGGELTVTTGVSGGGSGGGSSASMNGHHQLQFFHSPDPLSPFFRSVQERNLVGPSSLLPSYHSPSISISSMSSSSSSAISSPFLPPASAPIQSHQRHFAPQNEPQSQRSSFDDTARNSNIPYPQW